MKNKLVFLACVAWLSLPSRIQAGEPYVFGHFEPATTTVQNQFYLWTRANRSEESKYKETPKWASEYLLVEMSGLIFICSESRTDHVRQCEVNRFLTESEVKRLTPKGEFASTYRFSIVRGNALAESFFAWVKENAQASVRQDYPYVVDLGAFSFGCNEESVGVPRSCGIRGKPRQ